jgi:hypothetical protein
MTDSTVSPSTTHLGHGRRCLPDPIEASVSFVPDAQGYPPRSSTCDHRKDSPSRRAAITGAMEKLEGSAPRLVEPS